MSKIITEVDAQIRSAKVKFEAAKLEIVKTLAPVHQLMKAADEQVSWAEFAIIELKDRLTKQEVINNGLLDENLTLRDALLEARRELHEAKGKHSVS